MSGKPLRWMHGEVKTPPMSNDARREFGILLRELQNGESLPMPYSRPMPDVGPQCHELRVNDCNNTWRLVYRIDLVAIVILEVFEKKTQSTPRRIIELCRRRLKQYEVSFR
jgi:phage-related protein